MFDKTKEKRNVLLTLTCICSVFKAPHPEPGPSYQTRCSPPQTLTGMTSHSRTFGFSAFSNHSSSFRILGNALNQDAVQEIRQISDEHSKRKRPVRPSHFISSLISTHTHTEPCMNTAGQLC